MNTKHLYLIPGYGVPRDMAADGSYQRYLGFVFNYLFAEAQRGVAGTVVMSGGATDMLPPCRRTEAGEMAVVLKAWAARPECRRALKGWHWQREDKAILTVENLLNTQAWAARQGWSSARLTIFVEATRAARVRRLARLVFPGWTARVVPVDFDLSANRYLEADFLRRREQAQTRWEARAVHDPAFRRELHALALRRLAMLRTAGPDGHVAAVRVWWEKELSAMMASSSFH
jgi:hypothetical protein